MPASAHVPVYAYSAEGLLNSSQVLNNGSTATSLPAGSNSITATQTEGTLQLQETSSNTVYLSTIAPDADVKGSADEPIGPGAMAVDAQVSYGLNNSMIATRSLSHNNIPASSTRTSVSTQDERDTEMTHRNDHTHSMPLFPKASKVPSMALEPSTTVDNLNLKTSSGEVVLANGASVNTPSPAIDNQLGPVFATQSITAKSESQYIFPSRPTLSLGSTSTLGSSIPTSVPVSEISGSQIFVTSDFSTSLLPHVTNSPGSVKSPPALTINAQTVTADSLGHYLLDSQTLTRGGAITVSGTTISLAPHASDLVAGTSTEALHPSITAGSGAGASGTEVQKFSGGALGARDGMWGSSLMLLVSFFVLLWL